MQGLRGKTKNKRRNGSAFNQPRLTHLLHTPTVGTESYIKNKRSSVKRIGDAVSHLIRHVGLGCKKSVADGTCTTLDFWHVAIVSVFKTIEQVSPTFSTVKTTIETENHMRESNIPQRVPLATILRPSI